MVHVCRLHSSMHLVCGRLTLRRNIVGAMWTVIFHQCEFGGAQFGHFIQTYSYSQNTYIVMQIIILIKNVRYYTIKVNVR